MSRYVLDAFALLAFFQDEPGKPRVEELFQRAENGLDRLLVTVVNLGEMYYELRARRGIGPASRALLRLDQMNLEVVEVDRSLTIHAARAKAEHGLGYLDCFAYALALMRGATVVTGDDDFHRVEHLVAIDWLPQPGRG